MTIFRADHLDATVMACDWQPCDARFELTPDEVQRDPFYAHRAAERHGWYINTEHGGKHICAKHTPLFLESIGVHPKVDWNQRWMDMAIYIAAWSKDKSSKVGAAIIGQDQRLLSLGYNGLPRGVNDSQFECPVRHEREGEKYLWYEHAERNAIFNAAAVGVPLKGAKMYSPNASCCDCARAIVQSGIKTFYYYTDGPFFDRPDWVDRLKIALEIFAEGGVHAIGMEGYPHADPN